MNISGVLSADTRYAGFWRRVAASMVDILLLIPVLAIITYLAFDPPYVQGYLDAKFSAGNPYGFLSELLLVAVVVFFWVRYLGTPGKLLLDCHIVHAQTGQPLSVGRALLRYFGYYISMLPFMLGFLWIIWDRRKQGFHDKIANSVVIIHDESTKSLEELSAEYEKGVR